jgi:hypothetical protein
VGSPTPIDHFDRGKPFYPLVIVYTMGLHGFKELALRGLLDLTHEASGSPTLDQALDAVTTGVEDLDAGIRKLREPLSLLAACDGTRIDGPVGLTARELAENYQTILPALLPSLGSVLMLAHEIVKQQLPGRHDPILEFLFHTRNAVAHGGRWNFINGHPKYPAAWRPFTLDVTMHGQPLFKDSKGSGTMGPGDPIRLLWDIEQAYQSLKA